MRVNRLYWVGTRTSNYDATVSFFREVLGLEVRHAEQDFAVLAVADGSTVEVFGPATAFNQHLESPAVGFLVDDLGQAVGELQQAGAEIVLPVQQGENRAWLHFRAPDGFVYELVQEW